MCLPGTVETVRARDEAESETRIDRRAVLAGAATAALAAAFPAGALARNEDRRRRRPRSQDLTHVFRAGFPLYGNPPVFNPPSRRTLVNIVPDGYYGQEWTFWEHSGTHMDAPAHFVAGGRFSPQITPAELVLPIFVVNIARKAAAQNGEAAVTVDDLRRAERRHGHIPRGSLVAMYSGWESRVGNQDLYRNADSSGTYHFPGFSGEAVHWLLSRRRIRAIGVDTLSLDPGSSTSFDAHFAILRANGYGLENLANLKRVPARGATAYVGLVPWEQGSGGPARVIARW